MKTLSSAALAAIQLAALPAFAGSVITANLPPYNAIVNIDAGADGAASFSGNYTLWYHPFNTGGTLLQYTIPAGTYSFRVISPGDAAARFPGLTTAQTNQMFSAWTYNSPWITDYLVFDSVAATDFSIPQLFDGSPDPNSYGSAAAAYSGALSTGYYNKIRSDPAGRAGTTFRDTYTFLSTTTLIFVVPDFGLSDNGGGVSVLVAPASELNVDWSTVDGGGDVSSDGTLNLAGTAGQPDAGAMSDGSLSVQGGFWPALLISPVPPLNTNLNFKVYYSTFNYPNDIVGVVNGDGSGNTTIVAGQCPRLSPDGQWLAYRPRRNSNYMFDDLAVLNLTNHISTTVFYNNDYLVGNDWAHDSSTIHFDVGCSINRMNRDGSGITGFGINCYDDAPTVNPVDGSLAFHSSVGLFLSATNGANRQQVANTAGGDYWPAWSPDGQWLAFASGSSYCKIRPDGTGRTNLFSRLPGASLVVNQSQPAAFSPDGQWLVAAFNLNGANGIYAVAADGRGVCLAILTVPPSAQVYNFVGSVVPTAIGEPPTLTVAPADAGQVILSWTPATPGYVLQESTSPNAGSWANTPGGTASPVAVPALGRAKFYRLAHP